MPDDLPRVHGAPATRLLEVRDRLRADLCRLREAGVELGDEAPELGDVAATYRRWWRDPDRPGLLEVLERIQQVTMAATGRDELDDDLASVLAEANPEDAERSAAFRDDPVGAVLAVRRAVRLRAAAALLVAELADQPGLDDAFEAARRATEQGTQSLVGYPRRAVADLRRATALRHLVPSPADAGSVPGYPMDLRREDDPWGFGGSYQMAPAPPGMRLPGGCVGDDGDVVFDDAYLRAARRLQDADRLPLDPYDWARTRHELHAPNRRYVPIEIQRAFERVEDLARDPDLRRLRAGIRAEKRVGGVLDATPDLRDVVHGLSLGRGDADHVVIGPAIAVVETKAGRGHVELRATPAGQRLHLEGRPVRGEHDSPLAQVRHQAQLVREALDQAALARSQPVHAVLCVTGMTTAPFLHDGVWVCSAGTLPEVLGRLEGSLSAGGSRRVTRALRLAGQHDTD